MNQRNRLPSGASWWGRSRGEIKRAIPPLLNRLLLRFPVLYDLRGVSYETNLSSAGAQDLLSQPDATEGVLGVVAERGCSRCGATGVAARHLPRLDAVVADRADELAEHRLLDSLYPIIKA